MFALTPPPWFRTYMKPTAERPYPGIFLYMKNPVTWACYEPLMDLLRICTPNKSLKHQLQETIEQYKKEILEQAGDKNIKVKASLAWVENIPGQLFLRVCENTMRPQVTYVLVLEFTEQGYLERIVRAFTLSASSYPDKKGK